MSISCTFRYYYNNYNYHKFYNNICNYSYNYLSSSFGGGLEGFIDGHLSATQTMLTCSDWSKMQTVSTRCAIINIHVNPVRSIRWTQN